MGTVSIQLSQKSRRCRCSADDMDSMSSVWGRNLGTTQRDPTPRSQIY